MDFIAGSEQADILSFVESHMDKLESRTPIEGITYLNGKHRMVFLIDAHSDYVVKIDSPRGAEDMLATIRKGQTVTKELTLSEVLVPEVSMTLMQDRAIFIESKLDGYFSATEALSVSEAAYDRDESQWVEKFRQAALFIAKTGYYDVDWRNVLLTKEFKLGFIDFERIDVSPKDTGNGLLRLMEIAPLSAIDAIAEVAISEGLTEHVFYFADQKMKYASAEITPEGRFEDNLAKFKAFRKEELATHSSVREFHKSKGIETATQPIATEIDDLTPEQAFVIKTLNDYLKSDSYSLKWNKGNMQATRNFFWQPFLSHDDKLPIKSFDKMKTALDSLVEKRVIHSWETNEPYQESCREFTVQF